MNRRLKISLRMITSKFCFRLIIELGTFLCGYLFGVETSPNMVRGESMMAAPVWLPSGLTPCARQLITTVTTRYHPFSWNNDTRFSDIHGIIRTGQVFFCVMEVDDHHDCSTNCSQCNLFMGLSICRSRPTCYTSVRTRPEDTWQASVVRPGPEVWETMQAARDVGKVLQPAVLKDHDNNSINYFGNTVAVSARTCTLKTQGSNIYEADLSSFFTQLFSQTWNIANIMLRWVNFTSLIFRVNGERRKNIFLPRYIYWRSNSII